MLQQTRRSLQIVFALLLGGANVIAQSPQYTIQDLGGDTESLIFSVTGINRNGVVVGNTSSSAGGALAFRTPPNAAPNLPADYIGTLGGNSSGASGINSDGQVVGSSTTASGDRHAFRTAPNAAINPATDDLGTLGGQTSSANAINDSGQVAGQSATASGANHAFLTAPNSAINPSTDDIGALPFTPQAADLGNQAVSVNASGHVAGWYSYSDRVSAPNTSAFVYENGAITEIPAFIEAPVGNNQTPLNDSDQLVDTDGCSGGSACPAVWQNGTITPLVQCLCATYGLNNALQVVGAWFQSGGQHAFLYTGGTVYDLNSLIPPGTGWLLQNAIAINDAGQIIGRGQLNGVNHIFRLDPVATTLISPTTLIFGPQNVGTTSSAQFVTVTNNGSAPLTFTQDTVSGDFALAGLGTCGPSLAPGANCTISIHFTPTADGSRTGTLSINDDAPNSPQVVSLIGTGGQAQTTVDVSPTSLTFAAQPVGTTSSAQFVYVTNTGNAPLNFTQDTVTGDFALAGLGSCGPSLAPGAKCTISINFTPTAAGTRTGTLTIPDNAANSPQIVSLTGGQSQPAVSLSSTSLTFPAQTVGTTSSAQFVTVTNTGSAPLTFTQDTVSGDFALAGVGTCGTSLAAGANCTISIHFTPTAAGTRTGTLTINDNAPNSPQTVSLTGTGGQSGPAISLSPTSLTFAAQAVGTTSSAQFVTVTNTGSAPLTFTGDTVSGDFALAGVGTCGTSLAPGANCTISIHFTPTATGTRTGTLTIPDNAPDSPQMVGLSGTGQ